jgi:tetratricopeptide (TPR) repeat protein
MFFVQVIPGDRAPQIFLCDQGAYKSVIPQPKTKYYYSIWLEDIVDLNANGIPEIILGSTGCASPCGYRVYIFEWNGQEFQVHSEFHEYIQELTFEDVDHNGTKDMLAFVTGNPGGNLHRSDYLPKRYRRVVYGWNGSAIVQIEDQYDPPVYRFQAVQDGDRFTQLGKYEAALAIYQTVISDDSLDWWSPERATYIALDEDLFFQPETPLPTPVPELTEYPRLAAYATYRMIILYAYLNKIDLAKTAYTTLQDKFPPGDPGHPYTEMATAFLDAYRSSGKMYNACAAAVAYADAYPEILTPLGSDYHGWQSHTYIPADVCPFR